MSNATSGVCAHTCASAEEGAAAAEISDGPGTAAILRALPTELHDAARAVLRAGAAVRELRVRADRELRDAEVAWHARSAASREEFERLGTKQVVELLERVAGAEVVDLVAAIHSVAATWASASAATGALQHERDGLGSTIPCAESLAAALRAFKASMTDLEAAAAAHPTVECPWELAYCSDRDPDAVGATVDFSGGRLVNANGVGVFEDKCVLCGVSIQEGLAYGSNTPRIHCLDCTDVSLCMFCHGHSERLRGELAQLAGTNASMRDALAKFNQHMNHRCVIEMEQQVMLREQVFTERCLQKVIVGLFRAFSARPCFGTLKRDAAGELHVSYSTYAEEWQRITCLAHALARYVHPLDRIGISFKGSRLWYDVELAVVLRRCVSTGLPEMWTARDWLPVARRAGITVLFASAEVLYTVTGSSDVAEMQVVLAREVPSLRLVVVIEPEAHALEVWRVDEPASVPLVASGTPTILPFRPFIQEARLSEEDVAIPGLDTDAVIILHTSGTTGTPKGVISTAGKFLTDIDMASFDRPLVEASYLPPVWGTDKLTIWRALANGACVAFKPTESVDLFDFFRAVNPSVLVILPAIAKTLQTEFEAALDRELARAHPVALNEAGAKAMAHALAVEHVNACLGNRCRVVAIGGARVPPTLLASLRSVLNAVLLESYGTSESAGISSNGRIMPGVKVRLLDRPDLGYTNADLPYPRGEICVISRRQVAPDDWLCSDDERAAIAERYLEGGWFRTGDIGVLMPDNQLAVVDRASAVVKLANGRFFSPEKVEAALSSASTAVKRILVTPLEDGCTVAAIVVLRQDDAPSERQLPSSDPAASSLLTTLRHHGQALGLEAYELPSRLIVDMDGWTQENGCLTHNLKVNRRAIQAKHAASLIALAGTPADAPHPETATLLPINATHCCAEHVRAVVAAVTSCEPCKVPMDALLSEQGIDSLALLRMSADLMSIARQLVDAQVIATVPPRLTLAQLAHSTPADLVDWLRATSRAPAMSPSTALRQAIARGIERCEGRDGGEGSTTAGDARDHSPMVFVTGGTGFFGRFLVKELLMSTNFSICCLVRAPSDGAARLRLRSALSACGNAHFSAAHIDDAISSGRLVVLAGDVALPNFGLTDEARRMATSRTTVVVHAAAAVKFLDADGGIELLAPANIAGTAEALRFAADCRGDGAHVVHVSTMSVALGGCLAADGLSVVYSGDLDAYTLTKTASEVLVHHATHDKRVPSASVLRLPLLTWSKDGIANSDDWLVKLVRTCQAMVCVPDCSEVATWNAPIAMLPVDVCASAIARHVAHVASEAVHATGVNVVDFFRPGVDVRAAAVVEAAAVATEEAKDARAWKKLPVHAWARAVAETPSLPFAPLAEPLASTTRRISVFAGVQRVVPADHARRDGLAAAQGLELQPGPGFAEARHVIDEAVRSSGEQLWRVGFQEFLRS